MQNPHAIPRRTALLHVDDSVNPLLRLKWADKKMSNVEMLADGDHQYAAVTIDGNGSGDTKFIMFLDIGDSVADYTQYQFSAYTAGVTDPLGVDASPTHTQCTTLKALINALNALRVSPGIGIWASRLHAPADFSLDQDDMMDLSVTRLGQIQGHDILYKDATNWVAASTLEWYYRLGIPDNINLQVGAGRMNLHGFRAFVNSNSATDCVFSVHYDPTDNDEDDEVELAYTRYVPDASWTDLWSNLMQVAAVEEGPLLIKIVCTTTLTEGTAKVQIHYSSAEL